VQARYPERFAKNALELIAKRVSKASGDMRMAQAVCEAALAKHATMLSVPLTAGHAELDDDKCCQPGRQQREVGTGPVPVSTAAAALTESAAGGSAQARSHVAEIQKLPAQQQLLLCTLAIARGAALPTVPVAAATPPTTLALLASKAQRTPLTPLTNTVPRSKLLLGLARTPQRAPAPSEVSREACKTPQPPRPSCLVTPPSRAVSISFPMADAPLATPSTTAHTPVRLKGASPGKAAAAGPHRGHLRLEEVYAEYKAACKSAGLGCMGLAQVKSFVVALQGDGLLEVSGGAGASLRQTSTISLAISTDDVKHALAANRMLQPLVQQLT
jgi:hypothetical protein